MAIPLHQMIRVGAYVLGRHLRGAKSILFVPYALHDRDGYAAKAAERFAAMGVTLASVHRAGDHGGSPRCPRYEPEGVH